MSRKAILSYRCEWSKLPIGSSYQSRVCRQHREPWDYRHPVLSSVIFSAIVVVLVAFVVADHMNQKRQTLSMKAIASKAGAKVVTK
jgi:hypothetical protein